jgi:hypothetical protein
MSCPFSNRTYPLRQPKNHKPPVPRWHLVLPETVDTIYTAYIGIQNHDATSPSALSAVSKAESAIQSWLDGSGSNSSSSQSHSDDRPSSYESFTVIDGDDVPGSSIYVCYWDNRSAFERSLSRLRLPAIHAALGDAKNSIGLWLEHFATPTSRLETNYSGLDYLPGVARLPGTSTVEHTLSAYWGAARDRIPDSTHDLFEKDDEVAIAPPVVTPKGLGEHLVGTNYENMVHIRSGQWWQEAGDVEREAYEGTLEPTLRTGLGYLWENPIFAGTIGLRYLRNTNTSSSSPLRETCGAGFFRSLKDLETWAEKHKSHLAIYLGAIKHAKDFGPDRKLRTWHEVSVLKAGEARFEYLNCVPRTGAVRFVNLGLEDRRGEMA